MRLLLGYLKDHLPPIIGAAVFTGGVAFMFYLYSLPFLPLLYSLAVSFVFVLLVFVLPDFARYRKKIHLLLSLKESLPSILALPPLGDTLPEKELSSLCALLCENIRSLEAENLQKQQDMVEYYTLWVHQIKTPLAAMRLIIQAQPSPETEALAQELFKVERYVEMVLGYLRLDTMSSDLRLETLEVQPLVKQAVKKFAPQFIYKKLTMNMEDFDNRVITDEKWLVFVLEQLLSNALKYTHEGGVSISMDKDDVLVIRDTGIGISSQDLPRVFERGFTGYNGRRDKTSSGLGLFLSKQILDKLQTPIEITSTPEKGTTVRLFLRRGEVNHF